jgi:hypothetical protein
MRAEPAALRAEDADEACASASGDAAVAASRNRMPEMSTVDTASLS